MRWAARAFSACSLPVFFLCPPLFSQTLREAPSLGPGAPVRAAFVGPRALGAGYLEAAHDQAKWNHQPLSYDAARAQMFSYVDNVVYEGTRGVMAVYSLVFVPGTGSSGSQYREQGDQSGDGYVDDEGMNAEHVWPQSYFKQRLPMRADLHHLMPAFMHPNSVRGRMPFGETSGSDADWSNYAGARRGSGVFEPPDVIKGRVARAMLYFYTRYLGTNILPRDAVRHFWNSRIELLLRWNREHPPDAWEMQRNDRIEQAQGNRNPFIDDPDLADRIGAAAFRMYETSALYASSPVHPRAPKGVFPGAPRPVPVPLSYRK